MALIYVRYNRADANGVRAQVSTSVLTGDFVMTFDDALANRITRKDVLLALEAMEKAVKESRVFQAT